jgi:hypothetical protein
LLLVANSALPAGTARAAGAGDSQTPAQQPADILRTHQGLSIPVRDYADAGYSYFTYETTCTNSPECVEIAASLTRTSRNLVVEERRARIEKGNLDYIGAQIAVRTADLQKGLGTLTPEEAEAARQELNGLETAQQEARNDYDLSSKLVAQLQNSMDNLALDLAACEARCKPPVPLANYFDDDDPHEGPMVTPPADDDTPRVSTATKFGVGAAVAGGVAALLARGGGGDPGTPPTTPTTPTTTTPPATPTPPTTPSPPPFDPAGTYQVVIPFSGGNPEHVRFVALGSSGRLNLARNSPVRITSPNVTNWVPVSGEYDDAANRFNLTGTGTVAGVANVIVRFEGSITTAGQMTGSYTMGAGGELPGGQPVVYAVTGQKQ